MKKVKKILLEIIFPFVAAQFVIIGLYAYAEDHGLARG